MPLACRAGIFRDVQLKPALLLVYEHSWEAYCTIIAMIIKGTVTENPSPIPLSQVKVLYGGTELFDDEVRRTFHNDMLLALVSGACIAALVYILTSFSGRPFHSSVTIIHPPSPACSCSFPATQQSINYREICCTCLSRFIR